MMNKFLKVLLVFFFFSLASCVNGKSFENNSEYLAAKNGNVDAQYNVAMNFLNGLDGFPMDEREAKKWFEVAAEKGDAPAQNGLGIMYLRGMGGEQNIEKSEYYYRLAANQGHSNAQLQLALILLDKGADLKEVRYWLEKSKAQDNDEAKEKLSELNEIIK